VIRDRRIQVAIVAIVVAIGLLGWGLPNLAGTAFVEVRLVVIPVTDASSASRDAIIGSAESSSVSRLRFTVRVTNRYPLPVTIGGDPAPLTVELRSRAADGTSNQVWAITASAAELERGSDSPDGGRGSRAYLVAPGTVDYPVGVATGVGLVDAYGNALQPGRYDLRASAFGITSGLLPLVVID
jgi:hypothetical protein